MCTFAEVCSYFDLKKMKRIYILLISLLFLSCSDGDIIVSDFDFNSSTPLSLCRVGNQNVLHFVNPETNEAISFEFQLNNFTGRFTGLCPPNPETIQLSNANRIVYRRLNGSTSSGEYFCRQVPPSSPQVIEEFVSLNGGSASLIYSIAAQDDNDGVPAFEEDLNGDGNLFNDDSDGDGIPNFLDTDDDNDNVPTLIEIINDENPDEYPDFDGDGIPDYLDPDDDGDGVITRYEDLNAFDELDANGNPILNPANSVNEEGIPNYLNPNATQSLTVDLFRPNIISRTFRVDVVLTNVSLQQTGGEQIITFSTLRLGNFQLVSNNEQLPMTFEPPQQCP